MTPDAVTAAMADTFDIACYLTGFMVIVTVPLWWRLARDAWLVRRALRDTEVKWPIRERNP